VFFYNGTFRDFSQKSTGIFTPKRRDIPVALEPIYHSTAVHVNVLPIGLQETSEVHSLQARSAYI